MTPSPLINLELAVRWQDRRAHHLDRRYFPAVTVRDASVGGIGLADLAIGSTTTLAQARLHCAWDATQCLATARADWPGRLAGQRIVPRPGRWFPRLVLAGRHGFTANDRTPLRVICTAPDTVTVDLNPPLAGVPLILEARAVSAAASEASAAIRGELLPLLLADGPGMQAALRAPATPLPLQDEDLARADEASDGDFYATPRLVNHLDAVALEGLRELHRRFLRPGMRVLDLMASWNSHLPDDAGDIEVSGLGMNAEELARNPRLADAVVQDLNAQPALPFPHNSFDLVLCALSVEYLVRPDAIFAEVARVLRPGGTFVVSFSERWFPPKAIRLWAELHPFERIGLVLDHFERSGRFADLHSESLRGLPRPADDKYYRVTRLADPLYAVWGKVGAGDTALTP